MRGKRGTQIGWLAILSVLGWGGLAMAQNFAWPPNRDTAPPNAARPPATENFQETETDSTGIASPIPTVVGQNIATKPIMPSGGGQLDWRVLDNTNGPHVALIFDPVRQVFAVYHVDSASGQIMLKSVRNLSADLRLDQFNSSNPAPKDIQSMLDEAR